MLATYSFRSLRAQRWAVFPAAVAMALSVSLVTSMTLVIDNISRVLLHSGRAGNVLLMKKNTSELESELQPAELPGLLALPGIATNGARSFATTERLTFVRLHHASTKAPAVVRVRGVDAVSHELHDAVRVHGSMPGTGQPGFVVGERLLDKFSELKDGGKIRIGRSLWPIVGTLSAPGTVYESEMWCDREAMIDALAATRFVSIVVARVDRPEAVAEMNHRLSETRNNENVAITELDYNSNRIKTLLPYVGAAWFLTVVLMIGAAFSMVGTTHSLLMRRRQEFATLLTMGFKRAQIVAILTLESAILIIVGAGCGFAITLPLYGRTYDFLDMDIVVKLMPTLMPFEFGGFLVGAVFLASLMISYFYVRRLEILDALRSN